MAVNLLELRDYRNWVGLTPRVIHEHVIRLGGWAIVFPTKLPRWASRVRNYFNVTPSTLTRLPAAAEKKIAAAAQRFKFELDCQEKQYYNRDHTDRRPNPWGRPNPLPFQVSARCPAKPSQAVLNTGRIDRIAINRALHGAVYKDETNRLWYQMSAGSTIYHYRGAPFIAPVDAVVVNSIKGQNDTPVFKMIGLDGTGGSTEVIIKNRGSDTLVPAGVTIHVRNLVETNEVYQGSYNFSETTQLGLAAHERRDVKPHVGAWDFYVNPANRYWTLEQRTFPERDPRKPKDKPLAEQV